MRWLYLDETNVTDAGLHHLTGMTKLGTLPLTKTKVTDAGAENLRLGLPKCEIIQ